VNKSLHHDFSLKEWRSRRNISTATHYRLKRLGLAPEELSVPGTAIRHITPKADQEWEERMKGLAQQEAAKLEQQRRVEQARAAGQAAARSPLHISRRQRRDREGHRNT
jgi:hypothetical protein